jgi:hypothetical protein
MTVKILKLRRTVSRLNFLDVSVDIVPWSEGYVFIGFRDGPVYVESINHEMYRSHLVDSCEIIGEANEV